MRPAQPLQSGAMTLDESQARKILLAQAFEARGMLSDVELDRADDKAILLVPAGSENALAMGVVLARRASILIDQVQSQHPALVASLRKPLWSSGMYLVPLVALVMGFGADHIANPHRVDLLSAPILLLLAWNLVVYAVVFASLFRRAKLPSNGFWLRWKQRFQSWGGLLGRQSELGAPSRASAAFLRLWHPATATLNAQRMTALMHVAAAAWALGIVLSLLGRGVFVAYGVGWESTWLDAETLHFVLKVLFAPLVALLPVDPFTLGDIARLQVGAGAGGDVVDGRRWVLMYAGLLSLVIILPRLALASWAAIRARRLSQRVLIDLDDPYFQRIIDNLFPAQVRLGVITHRAADHAALARVLQQLPAPLARLDASSAACLIDTRRGDRLWWDTPQPGVDLVLHVVGQVQDLGAALAQLQMLGRPVLMLVRASEGEPDSSQLQAQCRQHIRNHELPMEVLHFSGFAPCWPLEAVLLDAIARRVPRSRSRGMVRLQTAWIQRNLDRFAASVQTMGDVLLSAASEYEAIVRLSVLDRVQPARLREHKAAKEAAMEAVQNRVHARFDRLLLDLLTLHGMDATVTSELVFHAEKPKFDVRGSIGARDAAMGGAASGAAAGASIDLMTGGMTLGAAAALGALAGGSAGLIGALWTNRDMPDGRVRIALGDDMLLALVQACVLRYLAVIHVRRGSGKPNCDEPLALWKKTVFEQTRKRGKTLLRQLTADTRSVDSKLALISELRVINQAVLQDLYPGSGAFASADSTME